MASAQNAGEKINVRRAARFVAAACTMVLIVCGVRFFAFPGTLNVIGIWQTPDRDPRVIHFVVTRMICCDLGLAVVLFGIFVGFVRFNIAEEVIQPFERNTERWKALNVLRRRNEWLIWMVLVFLISSLVILGMGVHHVDLWTRSVAAIANQGVFGLLLGIVLLLQYHGAAALGPA